MTLLSIQSLRKSFGTARALDGVSLNVARASRCAIVGPSGSGKTTLLRILAGFETPDDGRVLMNGALLSSPEFSLAAHQRSVGYVAQDGALFPHLSVGDNVGFGLARSSPGRDARIDELLRMVALDPAVRARRPHELSGGQQQRVALARALAQRPALILLDEPFSALDAGLRAATRKAVAQLLDQAGITTILVTHDQGEALSFAHQVAVMRGGQLVQAGTPMNVYLRPNDALTAHFLGDTLVMQAEVADGWGQCLLGRVAVDDATARGQVSVMLRPEQLHFEILGAAQAQHSAGAGCSGRVLDVDFYGPTCDLQVQLDAHPDEKPVRICASGHQAPERGAHVQVLVAGVAHVFPTP